MPGSDPDIAIVLAAGRGSRMGGPKSLMRVNGRPWWTIQRDRLVRAQMASVWVVSDEVCDALGDDPLPPRKMVPGDPNAPMMSSIARGILAVAPAPPHSVFILPIDTPAPSPMVWDALRTLPHPAAPSFGGTSGHPVRLPWSFVARDILPRATDPSWVSSARLDHLIGGELALVPVNDPDVIANLNTPADVERWVAQRHPLS